MDTEALRVAVNAAYEAFERAAREADRARIDAKAAQTRLKDANKAAQDRHIEYRRILLRYEAATGTTAAAS